MPWTRPPKLDHPGYAGPLLQLSSSRLDLSGPSDGAKPTGTWRKDQHLCHLGGLVPVRMTLDLGLRTEPPSAETVQHPLRPRAWACSSFRGCAACPPTPTR